MSQLFKFKTTYTGPQQPNMELPATPANHTYDYVLEPNYSYIPPPRLDLTGSSGDMADAGSGTRNLAGGHQIPQNDPPSAIDANSEQAIRHEYFQRIHVASNGSGSVENKGNLETQMKNISCEVDHDGYLEVIGDD